MLNYLLSVTSIGLGQYILASWLGLMTSAVLIFLMAKIAKRSLAMVLEGDGKLNGISVPADPAIAIEACLDVQQPLLVKIDGSVDRHGGPVHTTKPTKIYQDHQK